MPRGYRPDIRVEGGAQLGRLSKQLKEAGNKDLQKSMRKRLRKAIKPVAAEIKRDAGEVSRQVAASITTSFTYSEKRAGARIAAKRSKMPPGKEGLPGLLEFGNRNVYAGKVHRGKRGRGERAVASTRAIRHPVFADPSKSRDEWAWISQPIRPYFFAKADQYNASVTKALTKVLDDVEDEINRGIK